MNLERLYQLCDTADERKLTTAERAELDWLTEAYYDEYEHRQSAGMDPRQPDDYPTFGTFDHY